MDANYRRKELKRRARCQESSWRLRAARLWAPRTLRRVDPEPPGVNLVEHLLRMVLSALKP